MSPQSVWGGWMPSPRKLRPAMLRMEKPKLSVDWTSTGDSALGSTWRNMMRSGPAPMARAASTKSSSRKASTRERTMRAYAGTATVETAMTALNHPGPRVPTTAKAKNSDGSASSTSMTRMMNPSTHRPAKPATRPRTVPATPPMSTGNRPDKQGNPPAVQHPAQHVAPQTDRCRRDGPGWGAGAAGSSLGPPGRRARSMARR